MKAELIWGTLMSVDGENLTIYTTNRTPEGETLPFPSEGLGIDDKWFMYWSRQKARFTIIDGVVKEVSEG